MAYTPTGRLQVSSSDAAGSDGAGSPLIEAWPERTPMGLHNVGDGDRRRDHQRWQPKWSVYVSEPIYDVFCGIDVGKTSHYAVALAPDGQQLCGTDLPQDESRIRCLFKDLARYGRVLVVVDQPRNIGALPVAVARECGVDIAYLPGLRMRRIADLYPGRSKTDARDAFVIADAARTLPDTLLRIDEQNAAVEGLRLLAGFDADLASEENRLVNRIRSVLLSVHPALERTIGRQMHRPVGPGLLAEFGGPEGFTAVTRQVLDESARAFAPRLWKKITDEIVDALGQQSVIVPGTDKADFVIRTLARHLLEVRRARADLDVSAWCWLPYRGHNARGDLGHRQVRQRRPSRRLCRRSTTNTSIGNVDQR